MKANTQKKSKLPPHLMTQNIQQQLLQWYTHAARRLPWRATKDQEANPYHVLVSETMLQQTQVATVIAYFNRFIAKFATLNELANADEQDVLAAWQGLGYYRRARNLHAAAQLIVSEYKGEIPRDMTDILKLPGVGPYTAGAIASIAFQKPHAILDGNVARVLSRWFAIEHVIDLPAVNRHLWTLAAHLVPENKPGDFNQAMMELGALICTPTQPKCSKCPLAKLCEANRQGIASQLPNRKTKTPPKPVTHRIIAVHKRGQYLFQQRADKGLWSCMWQLPTQENSFIKKEMQSKRITVPKSVTPPFEALPLWIKNTFGLTIDKPVKLKTFTHQTTHLTITFELWAATVTSGRLRSKTGLWRSLAKIADLPMANPQHHAVAHLL